MAAVQDEVSSEDMLGAVAELQQHMLGFIKSMALKCVVDLGIPDAIHRRGGAATLADIAADTAVNQAKLPDLRRLMKLLSASGMFGATAADGEAAVYTLTAGTGLLVGPRSLSPAVRFLVNPVTVSPFFGLHAWLRSGPEDAARSLFEMAHGCDRWEMASKDATDNDTFNNAMVADSNLIMEAALRFHGDVFRGLSSLVDVGGGHGAAVEAVVRAFPHVECTVMDLPHVISQAPVADHGKLQFIAGDMFHSAIPLADAVLLKNVLHCWGNDGCVRILRRCKEAIPARDAGGKVVIIDMVTGSRPRDRDTNVVEATQNMFMMCINGVEREEQEWRKIFSDAEFGGYKIMPVLGPICVIEVYP